MNISCFELNFYEKHLTKINKIFFLYFLSVSNLINYMFYTIDAEAAQTSAMKVAFNLLRHKGIGGIYRGFGATFLRYSFLNISFFQRFFEKLAIAFKRNIMTNNLSQHYHII